MPSGSIAVYLYLPVYLSLPLPPHCLLRRIIVPLCMCTYLSKLALSNSLIKQLVNIETTSKTTNYTHTQTDTLYVYMFVISGFKLRLIRFL